MKPAQDSANEPRGTKSGSSLGDSEFFYGYLTEYLDGDLDQESAQRFEALLADDRRKDVPHNFQALRGRLQLALQSYFLKEDEKQRLHSYVQDPSVQATQEKLKIDQLGHKEAVWSFWRRIVLISIALGAIGSLVWKFAPEPETKFKPLEYLGYEAVAMVEEPGRLDLPTGSRPEIRQYLDSYPGLKFKPPMLDDFDKGWQLQGTSVIDYEIAKVGVVQYENPQRNDESLFHFSYVGDLSDLPKAEPGNMRGLVYQTYETDQFNIVAWQHTGKIVSMLVGRRSAPELAELALAGGGK